MPFTKQDTNINRKGRVKGQTNLKTSELKSLLVSAFENNLSEILAHQHELTLKERILLNKTLLPYVLPSLKHENFSNKLDTTISDAWGW